MVERRKFEIRRFINMTRDLRADRNQKEHIEGESSRGCFRQDEIRDSKFGKKKRPAPETVTDSVICLD